MLIIGLLMTFSFSANASPILEKHVGSGEFTRTYFLQLPDTAKNAPLAILLHGSHGTAKKMSEMDDHFSEKALKAGFAVVYADASGARWNDGRKGIATNIDDVGFIDQIIQSVTSEYFTNGKKVFILGISNGGMMAFRYACERADNISGIVAVAANFSSDLALDCKPSRALSVLLIHGTEDPLMPFKGGEIHAPILRFKKLGDSKSSDTTFDFWKKVAACKSIQNLQGVNASNEDTTSIVGEKAEGCSEHKSVARWTIVGGGHTWPNGKQYLPKMIIGKVTHHLGSAEIIQFLGAL